MIEKSLLRYFRLRISSLSILIPLFYLFHYYLGFAEGQMNRNLLNLKTVELNGSYLDENEKLFGLRRNREVIFKSSSYKAPLRIGRSRNSISKIQ